MFPTHLLACPKCKSPLNDTTHAFSCESCTKSYPKYDTTPCFIENIDKGAVSSHKRQLSSPLKKIGRFLKPPHHSIYLDNLGNTHFEGKELITLLQQAPKDALVLNIGSLSRKIPHTEHIQLYNLDISAYTHVDIIADGHYLPIASESLDIVLLKNVLEHVQNPQQILSEVHRVLKPGGILYIKNPWTQPFHAVPDDYYRWSLAGNKELLHQFDEETFQVSIGPSSAMSWMLREYLAILFSFKQKKLYHANLVLFGWLTFWIKYLDVFFRHHPYSKNLASAFYGIYRK